MKINDVFFQNSNLSSSINDSSGLWLFANFKSDCFIEALRIGFMLGFYEGIDYGIKSITGDPNKVTLRLEVLTKKGLYTYIDQGFERKDFRHSINKIQMNIGSNLKITQVDDNEINWVVRDKSEKLILDLNLKMDLFHLYPSLVMPNNFANMAVSPKTKVSGEVSIDSNKYKVDGFGALDQYWSKKIKSISAKKYGYSHYEPIMWNEEFTSVLYYIKSSDKKVYFQDLLLSFKGSKVKRLEEIDIKHISYEESSGGFSPTDYIVSAKGKDVEIEYEVKITPRDKILTWGSPEELLKSWVPDMPLISAKGVIREKGRNNINITKINGKGILEFILVSCNPFKESKKI